MTTINDINDQIAAVGAEVTFLIKPDIKALPDIINADEKFLNLIPGIYRDRNGILVLTDKRMIFIHKKLIGGATVESFQLNKIDSIQYNTGLLWGDISIATAGNNAQMKQISKKTIKAFCEMAQSQMHKA